MLQLIIDEAIKAIPVIGKIAALFKKPVHLQFIKERGTTVTLMYGDFMESSSSPDRVSIEISLKDLTKSFLIRRVGVIDSKNVEFVYFPKSDTGYLETLNKDNPFFICKFKEKNTLTFPIKFIWTDDNVGKRTKSRRLPKMPE